jgi:hypothetical protein
VKLHVTGFYPTVINDTNIVFRQKEPGLLKWRLKYNLQCKDGHWIKVFMFVPCIKALLLFHDDAHNYKITGILKQLKFRRSLGHVSVHAGTIIREPFLCLAITTVMVLYPRRLWRGQCHDSIPTCCAVHGGEGKRVGATVGILIVLIFLWFYNCVHHCRMIKCALILDTHFGLGSRNGNE